MNTLFQDPKDIARKFYESINEHDPQKSFGLYVSNNLNNKAFGGNIDREGWLASEIATLTAVPDAKVTVLDQVAEGSKVMTHWIYEGRHTGLFYGNEATGNNVRLEGIAVDIIENGKIIEHNLVADVTQFLQQFNHKET